MGGKKGIDITAAELDSFNSDDGLKANVDALVKLGGVQSVALRLNSSTEAGLKIDEDDFSARVKAFGANEVSSCCGFISLSIIIYTDNTLSNK